MYNDYVQRTLANSYQVERVAQARREQLMKHTGNRSALRRRFLAWSGDRLIAFGRLLKERHEPLPLPAPPDLVADNGASVEA